MSVDIPSEKPDNINVRRRIKLVLRKSDDFQDVRCECGALLFRELKKSAGDARVVEIKCRRCGKLHRS
jgi:hypothetical protein